MSVAIVVGGAECVKDDIAKALELFTPCRWYVCNDAVVWWPQVDEWCTLHPEHMDRWRGMREKKGLPNGYKTVSPLSNEVGRHGHHKSDRHITYKWPGMSGSGSSGLFAAKVAIEDGHLVVLAGVPMRAEDGHILRRQKWVQRDQFVNGWEKAMPYIRDKVRSFSGWTNMLLGAPTADWLLAAGALPPGPPMQLITEDATNAAETCAG